jgi:multidrug transporter EmrE-like cation transporter
LLVVYVAASCAGLYLIKAATEWRSPTFFSGFFLYALGAALWMVILRLMPLSLAFPIAAGSLVLGTMLTGAFLLNETVSPIHIVGAVLILAGITLIATNR